jgi:hypothetical protein
MMLERAYSDTQKKLRESYLAGGMTGVPVMVTMDMPGATIEHSHDETEQSDPSEIEMATVELHKLSEYAPKLEALIKNMPSLEGWVAAKITKASDYISSVYHKLNTDVDHESSCGCSNEDDNEMFTSGYEDSDDMCEYAARGCKCGGCESCN